MNVAVSASRARSSRSILIGVLGALAVALLWFVSKKLHYFADYSLVSHSEYYWPRRAGLIPHLTGVALAISVGLVQIWLG